MKRIKTAMKFWLRAFMDCPVWPLCGFCRWRPLWADDLGWMQLHPEGDDGRLTCKHCYHGEPGRKHILRYGVGER